LNQLYVGLARFSLYTKYHNEFNWARLHFNQQRCAHSTIAQRKNWPKNAVDRNKYVIVIYTTTQRSKDDKMEQIAHRLRSKLEVDTEFGSFLGDTRIKLLEAIEKHGSITQAAKSVPLSYKAAWDAIDAMNNLADQPLVLRSTGGKNGGGTQITEHGKKTVALYRALEAEYQAALDRLSASMNAGESNDFQQFRQLLKRLSMKASARNQFAGKIVGLREGHVDFEVRLKLDDDNELVAVITCESAETLGLTMGHGSFCAGQIVVGAAAHRPQHKNHRPQPPVGRNQPHSRWPGERRSHPEAAERQDGLRCCHPRQRKKS
jgi:molybdate transport repressor ModE-like protein/molybdopterin-binding protein